MIILVWGMDIWRLIVLFSLCLSMFGNFILKQYKISKNKQRARKSRTVNKMDPGLKFEHRWIPCSSVHVLQGGHKTDSVFIATNEKRGRRFSVPVQLKQTRLSGRAPFPMLSPKPNLSYGSSLESHWEVRRKASSSTTCSQQTQEGFPGAVTDLPGHTAPSSSLCSLTLWPSEMPTAQPWETV